MRHLIDPLDFSPEEIDSLLNLADRIRSDPAAYQDVAAHKKLATLFYEPSTRTRLSFEAAMLNLGGHVLGFPSENVSSASKGESVADTIRVISCNAAWTSASRLTASPRVSSGKFLVCTIALKPSVAAAAGGDRGMPDTRRSQFIRLSGEAFLPIIRAGHRNNCK